MITEILVLLAAFNVTLVIINTYWAYKRTCYNRDTYEGSVEYWESWKKRSKDVIRKVLEEMTEKELERELKRKKRNDKRTKKKKKLKRVKRRD